MMSSVFRIFVGVSILAAAGSCASEDAHFEVKVAPGFEHQGDSLSVLGVFKDGRMSTDAWDALGPKLSPGLGKNTCEVAYSSRLVTSNSKLAEAIDDHVQANGVTDDLLEQVSPLAKGSSILTITVAGEVAAAPDAGSASAATPTFQPTRGRGGRRRRSTPSAPPGEPSAQDSKAFGIAASVYSIRLHRSVALVQMTYTGRSVNDAIDKFRQELARDLQGATCAGWDWNVEIDEGRIRRLGEP